MLTNWHGFSAHCSDNGFCRHTGGICRPSECEMMNSTFIPEDEELKIIESEE